MKRETSNVIRFILEDLLPPIVRDTRLFGRMADLAIHNQAGKFAEFRMRATSMSRTDYEALYRDYKHVHDTGDNTSACLQRIAADTIGMDVCDVGCGGGHVLSQVRALHPEFRLVGVDIAIQGELRKRLDIRFVESPIETLPFEDQSFDTVICTHVLEHVLDIQGAIAELRRITRRRLIIVVPREREARYTFNPHFHFFPYKETFMRTLKSVPRTSICEYISRDIFYREDRPT